MSFWGTSFASQWRCTAMKMNKASVYYCSITEMPVKFTGDSWMDWNFVINFLNFQLWRCFVCVHAPHGMDDTGQEVLINIVVLLYEIFIIYYISCWASSSAGSVHVVNESFQIFQKKSGEILWRRFMRCTWPHRNGKLCAMFNKHIKIYSYYKNHMLRYFVSTYDWKSERLCPKRKDYY